MDKHKELNRLVVHTLTLTQEPTTAREIYQIIRAEPIATRRGMVTFKGFVKVINTFPEIEQAGRMNQTREGNPSGPVLYFLKNK